MIGLEILKNRIKDAPQSSGVYLFKNKKDTIGILSNHLITLLHLGQKDRSNTTPLSCGNLKIQTLEKLPQILPKIKKKANITN